jgi:hypothetical protein
MSYLWTHAWWSQFSCLGAWNNISLIDCFAIYGNQPLWEPKKPIWLGNYH